MKNFKTVKTVKNGEKRADNGGENGKETVRWSVVSFGCQWFIGGELGAYFSRWVA